MKFFSFTYIISLLLILGCKNEVNKKISLNKEIELFENSSQNLKQKNFGSTEKIDNAKLKSIKNIIDIFKKNDVSEISKIVNFPLQRQYPIPTIKDKKEFKIRFSEVFDEYLIKKIANSTVGQWTKVGWRGIMLDDGVIWMSNSDGIITSVNYQTNFEKKQINELIAKEKNNLHFSLKNFEKPTYKIITKSYLIRIDELANHKFRYASWAVNASGLTKPDIIINNGVLSYEGSGSNHVISFKKGSYTYNVYKYVLDNENLPNIVLEIIKDDQKIFKENGKLNN